MISIYFLSEKIQLYLFLPSNFFYELNIFKKPFASVIAWSVILLLPSLSSIKQHI